MIEPMGEVDSVVKGGGQRGASGYVGTSAGSYIIAGRDKGAVRPQMSQELCEPMTRGMLLSQ